VVCGLHLGPGLPERPEVIPERRVEGAGRRLHLDVPADGDAAGLEEIGVALGAARPSPRYVSGTGVACVSRAPRLRRAGDGVHRNAYPLERGIASPLAEYPPSPGLRSLASWVKSPRNAPLLWRVCSTSVFTPVSGALAARAPLRRRETAIGLAASRRRTATTVH
jgi:hypothetical protein